jgi:hypothetical protein
MSSTVKLRVGSLDALGQLTAGSMARAIDDAMVAQVKLGANEDPHGRRKLALAIAQGVIDHLVANAQAIMVTVPNTGAGSSTHEQPATQIDKW